MPDSLPFWIGGALALFWFVGAYNRLVRLRSLALQAYATLDAALVRQLEFVLARAAEADTAAPASVEPHAGVSLRAAAGQLATLLAATRLRPLDPAGIAALATALHVLLAAWQHLHPEAVVSFEADGTLSRPVPLNGVDEPGPDSTPIAWPEPSAAAEIARSQFNLAVAQYNAAIGQFPALLVAWIMQLRPAAPLR
ncbi:lema family protein [Variovorax saccharolyticus]|uniref:lema family protein n=1 Tax=Variovorax saccharolyticus TaxID=3053516 RepID=UPI002575C2C8|nr:MULTISPECIES: lema family protein [unclassified Variovorax]MDM0019654.1 lema family protein [Variovorax sp. J22R187]MDM0027806.1 lema family protein [Variovorax sp. J31P216]